MSKITDKIEWVEGAVQTEVYKEINQCPIIAVDLKNDLVQKKLANFSTDAPVNEIALDSEYSDDDDDIGEHTKSHESKTKFIFGEKNEFSFKPIPCKRDHAVYTLNLDLKMFEKFAYN